MLDGIIYMVMSTQGEDTFPRGELLVFFTMFYSLLGCGCVIPRGNYGNKRGIASCFLCLCIFGRVCVRPMGSYGPKGGIL